MMDRIISIFLWCFGVVLDVLGWCFIIIADAPKISQLAIWKVTRLFPRPLKRVIVGTCVVFLPRWFAAALLGLLIHRQDVAAWTSEDGSAR